MSATKCLEWVKAKELSSGGLCAGDAKGTAYPEVTGYMIPTLILYGENDLATRLGEWLLSVQLDNGAFPSMSGQATAFDTAMCIQGLDALGYKHEAERARQWLWATSDEWEGTQLYHILTAAIMSDGRDIITCDIELTGRLHYIAYALEGLARMGIDIEDSLSILRKMGKPIPYHLNPVVPQEGICMCGNCQMAILLGDKELLDMVELSQLPNGGIPSRAHARHGILWSAKYYLDGRFLLG